MNADEWDAYNTRAERLAKLEDGWYWHNDGLAMSPLAMEDLRNIIVQVEGKSPMPAMFPFPGMEGEILASWGDTIQSGSIIVHNNRDVEAYVIDHQSNKYCGIEDKTLQETVEVLVGWFNDPAGIEWEEE